MLVGAAGATFDIVIDAYRIEILKPRQLGVGSGMSQYGWRIGSVAAGALALVLAARVGWEIAYLACAAFALPAMLTGLLFGEPERHREPASGAGSAKRSARSIVRSPNSSSARARCSCCCSSCSTRSATRSANLTLRLLLDDLGFTNDEIAI